MHSPTAVVALTVGLLLSGCLDGAPAPPASEGGEDDGILDVPAGGLLVRFDGTGWARVPVQGTAGAVFVATLLQGGLEVNATTPVLGPGDDLHVLLHPPEADDAVPDRWTGSTWMGHAAADHLEAPAGWAIDAPSVEVRAVRFEPGAPHTLWIHTTVTNLSFLLAPQEAVASAVEANVTLVPHPGVVVVRPELERRAVGALSVEPDVQYTMSPVVADVPRGHYFIRITGLVETNMAAGALQVWAGWTVGEHCLGGVHTVFPADYTERQGGAFWGRTDATSLELCGSIGRTVVGDMEIRDAEAVFAFIPYDAP